MQTCRQCLPFQSVCRIYHVVVCQQKPIDPCTATLSHRAGCYHSNLLRTLPSNCFRSILDTPLRNAMSRWVCAHASVFLSVCFNDRLVTHDDAQLKHRSVCLSLRIESLKGAQLKVSRRIICVLSSGEWAQYQTKKWFQSPKKNPFTRFTGVIVSRDKK